MPNPGLLSARRPAVTCRFGLRHVGAVGMDLPRPLQVLLVAAGRERRRLGVNGCFTLFCPASHASSGCCGATQLLALANLPRIICPGGRRPALARELPLLACKPAAAMNPLSVYSLPVVQQAASERTGSPPWAEDSRVHVPAQTAYRPCQNPCFFSVQRLAWTHSMELTARTAAVRIRSIRLAAQSYPALEQPQRQCVVHRDEAQHQRVGYPNLHVAGRSGRH
ncbi:hypothetical protein XTPLMG728_1441 [Xanthomonas translucens pv. poae]|uniref:Uncharacterized protein n=1 Tax=Xanthomonas graminis pv. poae TaxID=227946 RepID=A0A0K2ZQ44_9XANT|nr:hypothetical protein XTPLMG728_1441 [Xanthomonas translucens pv. poae]